MERVSPVGVQKGRPASGDGILKTAAPQKDGQVVGAVAIAPTVKVEEGQGAVRCHVGVVALKIAMADALLKPAGRQPQKPFAQGLGKALDVGPIVGAMGQERLDEVQRPVNEMGDVQVEAGMRAAEIVEGVVHAGHGVAVGSGHLLRLVRVGRSSRPGASVKRAR